MNGHICEDESHGDKKVEAIVGLGMGPGKPHQVRWLCDEHYNQAMYELGQMLRAMRELDKADG